MEDIEDSSSGSSDIQDRAQDKRPSVTFLLGPHQDQEVDTVDTVDTVYNVDTVDTVDNTSSTLAR